MKPPLVSVIMPAFNCESTIESSIMSVLDQTLSDFELIVIDDSSTDNTHYCVEKISATDSRIRYFRNKVNLGGARTRNRALGKAFGRYIAFLDSDDLWMKNKLEYQINYMRKNKVTFSFSSYFETGRKDSFGCNLVPVPTVTPFCFFKANNFVGCLTAVYDSDFYGKVEMPIVKKRHDYALWLKIMKCGGKIRGINEPLAFYSVGSGTLSKNKISALAYHNKVIREYGDVRLIPSFIYSFFYLLLAVIKQRFKYGYRFFCFFVDIVGRHIR